MASGPPQHEELYRRVAELGRLRITALNLPEGAGSPRSWKQFIRVSILLGVTPKWELT